MSVPTLERPASPPQPPQPPPAASGGRRNPPTLALALGATALLATIALTIALLAAGAFDRSHRTTVVTQPAAAGSGLNAAALYASDAPGVVDITAHSTTTTAAGPFGLPRKAQATDTGTGTVLDTQGRILTADHVIAGASSISVTLRNGDTRPAKLLGGDSATDTAVLKLDPSGMRLHPLRLGSLATLRIGDPIAVIGDPFSFQRSLSSGLISGLDRTIQAPNGFTIAHAVQTDAAMNPGNSGGPVLDARGRVIGVADQIATGGSGADSSTGVGFAVPIDIAKSELTQLEAGHAPAHAHLGVSAEDATVNGGKAGALVGAVAPRGPAAHAGIQVGDVIVKVGAASISGVNDLVTAASSHKPGDRVAVTVIRHGKPLTRSVTLAKEPSSVATAG
jgi:putative serine protease PepD